MSTRLTNPLRRAQRGNLLVGCGVALLIFIILLGIGTYVVMTNWRGWTATWTTSAVDTALTKAQIDPIEQQEIMAHFQTLMTRFENKEVTMEQLGKIVEEVMESPLLPSALVIGLDRLYLTASDIPDEEKAQARIDFARYTQALFDDTLPPESINEVLAPVITNTPDDNDIRLNMQVNSDGRTITALRSPDEVTSEDLRTLIATAKAKADEAGVGPEPEPVDLSDEFAKAIAIALGEATEDPELIEPAPDAPTDAAPADDTTALPGADEPDENDVP